MPDIAHELGVRVETVHAYRSRAKAGQGTMPPPTGVVGRTPYWSEAAIRPWLDRQQANRKHIGRTGHRSVAETVETYGKDLTP